MLQIQTHHKPKCFPFFSVLSYICWLNSTQGKLQWQTIVLTHSTAPFPILVIRSTRLGSDKYKSLCHWFASAPVWIQGSNPVIYQDGRWVLDSFSNPLSFILEIENIQRVRDYNYKAESWSVWWFAHTSQCQLPHIYIYIYTHVKVGKLNHHSPSVRIHLSLNARNGGSNPTLSMTFPFIAVSFEIYISIPR